MLWLGDALADLFSCFSASLCIEAACLDSADWRGNGMILLQFYASVCILVGFFPWNAKPSPRVNGQLGCI